MMFDCIVFDKLVFDMGMDLLMGMEFGFVVEEVFEVKLLVMVIVEGVLVMMLVGCIVDLIGVLVDVGCDVVLVVDVV